MSDYLIRWQEIERAPKIVGREIIGCRWHDGRMVKEPFISFWSPTLDKFYCGPTHFIDMPEPPK